MILYRAANDDIIVGCASFSTSIEAAKSYLDNPGYGGARLFRAEVEIDDDRVLDLIDCDDPIQSIIAQTGLAHPGAIGPDEWVPRISYDLRNAGIEWVRVRESYPADTETWIFVGADDPEMEDISDVG